jgi:uncharacterized membrane protein
MNRPLISAGQQTPSAARAQSSLPFIWKLLFCLIFLAALAVRARAIFNDLWLDEILSLSLAQRVSSPLDIITKLYADNNHPLNTLFMFLMGPQDHWFVYRLPILLAGAAAVAMAGLIGSLRGRLEAFTAMTLTGASYFLITFSSEARGYGFVILFLLTGYYAALRYAENRAWRWAVLFWVSFILGILSHLLFLYFFLAICLWTVCRLLKKRGPLKDLLVSLVSLNLVPLLFLGVFYWFHMRHLVLLGGPVIPLLLVSFENSGQRRGGSRLRELYNNAGRYFGGRRLCGGHAPSHPGR